MEKLPVIIVVLGVIACISIVLRLNISNNFFKKKITQPDLDDTSGEILTYYTDSCTIICKHIESGKNIIKMLDYDDIEEGKDLCIGRQTGTEADELLFLALPCNKNIMSRNHFCIFKQVDGGLTRFGVADNNSKNHVYARHNDFEEWVKVEICEINNNTQIRAGEYIFSFIFSNYYSNSNAADDVKIYDNKPVKRLSTVD